MSASVKSSPARKAPRRVAPPRYREVCPALPRLDLTDRYRVLVGRYRSDHSPEDRHRETESDVNLGPLGPPIDAGARAALTRPESGGPVSTGQIAEDRARLPNWLTFAVAEDGNGAIRVHR